MKKKMVVFYSLMFLPLVVVLIALQFLPEQIPAHYDMNNQVTRWGSKYETLIFPVITVLFGYFMLAMVKLSSKQEEKCMYCDWNSISCTFQRYDSLFFVC